MSELISLAAALAAMYVIGYSVRGEREKRKAQRFARLIPVDHADALIKLVATRQEYGASYFSILRGAPRIIGPYKSPADVYEASQSPDWPLLSRDDWELVMRRASDWRKAEQEAQR
jgi:hypothetical protein